MLTRGRGLPAEPFFDDLLYTSYRFKARLTNVQPGSEYCSTPTLSATLMAEKCHQGGLTLLVVIHCSGRPCLLMKYTMLYATIVESTRNGKR